MLQLITIRFTGMSNTSLLEKYCFDNDAQLTMDLKDAEGDSVFMRPEYFGIDAV